MKDEWTAEEWAAMVPADVGLTRKPAVKYECDGSCGHVFRCRSPGMRFACGRWFCACPGGSDDNRCAECWCRLDRAAPGLIRKLLRGSAWLAETTLCRLIAGEDEHPVVVDALFQLVVDKQIEWFGDNARRGAPLRYRLTRRKAA
ncbi:MAG TPA: hypothetical protein VH062_01985 [Polyangiaceae bacterium]|jgi:hypothetical protein|nr:hypothetical protein [Polyangiaceae bacterium]